MELNGPRDLPEFRAWLLNQWRPGQLFDELDRSQHRFGLTAKVAGRQIAHISGDAERHLLPRAALWWVAEDMARLIDHAYYTLPETTLTEDLIPDDHGLVVFATPITGTQADCGDPIETHAMTWTRGSTHDGFDGIHITTYNHPRKGQQIGNSKHGYMELDMSYWNPTGTCNWLIGNDTEGPSFQGFEGDEIRLASMGEDRRVLAALWLLASQPLADVTIKSATHNKAKRRRLANSGITASNDVRLINIRRRPSKSTDEHQGTERNYDHRWIVGFNTGGFWRQQACGPGWSQHRPKFIMPYPAGPDDKPLRITKAVKVVKGDAS
jgi:hypothetical protein